MLVSGTVQHSKDFAYDKPLHLRQHETRFNGLTEADFVGQQSALRKRGLKGKESGIHLMGIQIYLGADDRSDEPFPTTGRAALGQFVREVLGVIGRYHGRGPVHYRFRRAHRTQPISGL